MFSMLRTYLQVLVCAICFSALNTEYVSAAVVTYGPERIPNGTFDRDTTGWSSIKYGTLTATFSTIAGRGEGSKAIQVRVSNYVSGAARWVPSEVKVQSGEMYEYKEYYRSDVYTSIIVQYRTANNQYIYDLLAHVLPVSSWKQRRLEFAIPQNVVGIRVFHTLEKNGYLATDDVSLRATSGTASGGMASLSFDDGTKDHIAAARILTDLGVKGTFYIISETVTLGWGSGYVNREDVLAIGNLGHEIASHTIKHANLAKLSDPRTEIAQSRTDLQSLVGQGKVLSLAYPYGAYSLNAISHVKSAGYSSARTIDSGLNTATTDPFRLRSVLAQGYMDLATLKAVVLNARKTDRWLILTFHRIGDGADAVKAEVLRELVSYIKSLGMPIVTVTDGLRLRR